MGPTPDPEDGSAHGDAGMGPRGNGATPTSARDLRTLWLRILAWSSAESAGCSEGWRTMGLAHVIVLVPPISE